MNSFDEHTDCDDPDQTESRATGACQFAHECELREQAEHEPLGGADVEHCQRMRG